MILPLYRFLNVDNNTNSFFCRRTPLFPSLKVEIAVKAKHIVNFSFSKLSNDFQGPAIRFIAQIFKFRNKLFIRLFHIVWQWSRKGGHIDSVSKAKAPILPFPNYSHAQGRLLVETRVAHLLNFSNSRVVP